MTTLAPVEPNPFVLLWVRKESGYDLERVAKRLAAEPICQLKRRKTFFVRNGLNSTDSWSMFTVSRPAGLLLFFGKVQLTSVGIFLPGLVERKRRGV